MKSKKTKSYNIVIKDNHLDYYNFLINDCSINMSKFFMNAIKKEYDNQKKYRKRIDEKSD